MPFAWVLNLDAELELADPRYQPTTQMRTRLQVHARRALSLLSDDDWAIEVSEGPRPSHSGSGVAPQVVGRAWCPTPSARSRLAALGIQLEPAPPFEVLRRVNHRLFAYELGGGLPGQLYVTSPEQVAALLDRRAWPLLLKRPYSFAGRGQQRLYACPTPAEAAWIRASLRENGLIVEPLVRPTLEFSQHGFITPQGRLRVGEPCVQNVSDRGVFLGVRRAEPVDWLPGEREALAQSVAEAGDALRGAGYFGPFGVDAYRYAPPVIPKTFLTEARISAAGLAEGFCRLSEINARYTLSYALSGLT